MSYNRIILVGNLTHDPYTEQKQSISGPFIVCNFQIAVDYKGSTDFIQCSAYNRQAEVMSQFCSKGSKILVEGRLRIDAKDGVKYHNIEANRVVFLDSVREKLNKEQENNDSPYDYKGHIPF